jgi:acyl-homoserine lactone acylase PvdQ
LKRIITGIVALCALALAAPAAARDYAQMARNIIPSGQYGSVPIPAGADQQARMYDGLTPLFDRVRRNDLFRFFKSERLGTAGQGPLTPEPVPGRPGLRIMRDRFHVPHIRGRTVDDVTFGTGWVTAQDRELLLEQARFNTRVAAVDVPGVQAFDLVRNLRSFTPSAQTEREVAKQAGVLRRKGRKGRRLLHDIDVFVSGINAHYASKGKTYERWTRNDVFSLNALKGQFLGEGGGGDALSAQLLWSLQRRLGRRRGESVWNDLRQRQDPETVVSVDGRFRYASRPRRRRGNVIIQDETFEPTVTASRASSPPTPPSSSNILMISRRRSITRRPLFVGGPQIGYFYPGLTMEVDLRGPGIQVRGATAVPFPGYMLIGRGEDFAWTLTSAGGDIIDTYVETLCGGSDLKYLYKGRCRDMQRFDAGTLDGKPIVFYRTVHGPVFGYARTAAGTRVALSRKRSSYGRDTLDQLFFQDLTRGRVRNVRQFFRAANQSPQTFNAFYADNRDIGMFTTGRFPIRPRTIDSGLPTDGRGRYEWRGVLSRRRHVQGVNPRSGVLTNWNNKPGRGWPAADNQFNYGSIHRDELLKRGLRKRRRHSLASVTGVMNAAATQDIRAVEFVPLLAQLLKRGRAPNELAARMLELLESWNVRGGSRLDRDLNGQIDEPGAAILDTAWDPLVNAAMAPVLGPLTDELDDTLHRRFAAPPMGQSSGWYQYLAKDLRRLLGQRVRGRLRNRYCGRGNLANCARDLWAALNAAGVRLAAQQGPNPDAWRASATPERISFTPGLLTTTMRYTNRPSGIQQVISFKGHRRRRR